jgi:hypothetical protein
MFHGAYGHDEPVRAGDRHLGELRAEGEHAEFGVGRGQRADESARAHQRAGEVDRQPGQQPTVTTRPAQHRRRLGDDRRGHAARPAVPILDDGGGRGGPDDAD